MHRSMCSVVISAILSFWPSLVVQVARDVDAAVGFQPEYLLVRGASGADAVQHFDAQGAATDVSSFFSASSDGANRIQALQASGFQVGSDNDVNNGGVA